MQPYFFPYIGYWQLISAVDTFVIYDDVNYFKKGFVSRNYVLVNGARYLLRLELLKASQNKKINEILVGGNTSKILQTISSSYKKAPNFEEVFLLLKKVLMNKNNHLAQFLFYSITQICEYLEIPTKLIISSEVEKNNALRGQNKIIQICQSLQATQYINAIGGQELYQKEIFSKQNVELSFLKSKSIQYSQYKEPFVSNLSIIDVLMFNDKERIKHYLSEYVLL